MLASEIRVCIPQELSSEHSKLIIIRNHSQVLYSTSTASETWCPEISGFLTVPRTRKLASFLVLIVLLIGFLNLPGSSGLQPSNGNVQSVSPTSDGLVVPVRSIPTGKPGMAILHMDCGSLILLP